mgnify:CR=1 FL=1
MMSRRLILVGLLSMTACLAWLSFGGRAEALGNAAIGTRGPTPNSGVYNNSTNVTPYYVVGMTPGQYPYALAQMFIYVPESAPASGLVTITVENAGSTCAQYTSGGLTGPDYSVGGGNPDINFRIYAGSTPITAPIAGGSGCGNKSVTVNLSQALATQAPYVGYNRVFLVYVQLQSGAEGENSFRISNNFNGLVGLTNNSTTGFGFRAASGSSGNINNGNYWDGELMFAPLTNCDTLDNPVSAAVRYFDADADRKDWNPNIRFLLQRQAFNSSGDPSGAWSTIRTFDNNYLVNNQDGSMSPFGGQFQTGYRYRVLMENVGVRNTIKLSLDVGLSQLSARKSFTTNDCYRASCTISPSGANGVITATSSGQAYKLTITVRNTADAKGATWSPGSQLLKRTSPSTKNLALTKSAVSPDETVVFTDDVNAPTGNSPPKVFTYRMYGTNNGTNDPFGPSCTVTIRYKSKLPPNPGTTDVEVTCTTLRVVGNRTLTSSAPKNGKVAYEVVFTAVGQPQDVPGPPPRDASALRMMDNGLKTPFSVGLPNSNGQNEYPIFQDYGELRPQFRYKVTIRVDLNQSSNYDFETNLGSDILDPCLGPDPDDKQPGFTCGGLSTIPDLEPGQSGTAIYTLNFYNNRTGQTFNISNGFGKDGTPDNNGYGVVLRTSGGLSASIASVQPFGPGDTTVAVTIPLKADWQGDVGIDFYYSRGDPGNVNTLYLSCPGITITPKTRPLFKVLQGDISTGGGFQTDTNCPTTAPSFISPTTQANKFAGGLRAFANPGARKGSSADFAAYALGLIQGTNDGPLGFFSGNIGGANLQFANTTEPLGGQLDDQSYVNFNDHCATDYFTATQISPVAQSGNNANIGSLASGPGNYQYLYTPAGGVLTLSGSLNKGISLTIYVDGDVNIASDIVYGSNWSPFSRDVPYLAVVARGNIHVEAGVTRIDGLYVAQPKAGVPGTGIFSSCSFSVGFASSDNLKDCLPTALIVNGSVVAQKIYMARTNGTLCKENGSCGLAPANIAEIFNFSPSLIVGLPAFAPTRSGAIVPTSLEALFSLPPVL